MEDRRKSKRIDLLGKLIIRPLGKGDNPESVTIDVQDCSRHGLGFVTDKHLTMGDNYEAYLTIWTKEVLHVFIQIVRGEKKENENIFSYGSVFIGMPDAERQRIAVYETVQDQTTGGA
ncbi:MAG: PilZ domain-containing protein [Lachnospiraceae bacterium]|nr:PilZ domain-containing protein [Butyrivibrio sp.]MBQ6903390.1 PilZ domain-containing protein [Lachnospiraceae bacterium]MBR0171407.1 PilZ domain-containing protein [Lachnospiraceae bacterium]